MPARTLERRSFRADIPPNGGSGICPDGQSGWHGTCPFHHRFGQTVIYRGSEVLTSADAEQTTIVENMVNGESFTLATLNADGMPKQILFIDVNTEGPGEEYSPAIARYLLNKKFDIILTQENFNYNAALTAPFDSAGYRHDIWGGGIDVELALDRLINGEELEGIFHIDGLTAFWSPMLQVAREDSVRWTAGYGLFEHGWDAMVLS